MSDADLVMAAINRHPNPAARLELAEALGLRTYVGWDVTRHAGTKRAIRPGQLDQETQ